jgi:osmotically-inducible protein OsmY
MTSDDYQVRRNVLAELDWDSRFDSREIGVAVKDGVVTLTGEVPGAAQSQAVQESVESVEGVNGVANELRIQLAANVTLTDTQIADQACRALRSHADIPTASVRVIAQDGWLSLDGEVDSPLQREAAQRAVEVVPGVLGVTNRIAVRNLATAAGVKDQILDAFRRLARLDADRIQVAARDGTVTLQGEVSSVRERLQAANAAWQASGVAQVIDNLTINPTPRDH